MPFQQFGFPPALLANLRALGYTAPTPIQAQGIPAVASGKDVVGTAQTGTGKTAAFLLPIIQKMLGAPRGPATALVLTPTRELAHQIDQCFRKLAANTALRSTLVIGGVAESPQERALAGKLDLVVATPGRLLAHLRGGRVHLKGVTTLVLDEADQMFDLGFFPDLKRILAFLPARKQTLLFSATMPPEVAELSKSILRDPVKVSIGTQGTAAPTVTQTIYPVPVHRKAALLEHLLEQLERPSVLVFTRTKSGARRLAQRLSDSGHYVGELHSGRSPSQRTRVMQGFRDQAFPILIATNIAARGLDVRHVTHVVNFDVAGTPEEHVHRIGRVGRAGDEGEALVLLSPDEYSQMARIERRVGKLPCRTLDDFDYAAKPEAKKPQPAPGRKPAGRPVAEGVGAMGKPPRKPNRGQGGRRR
ncbi:MAG: DEAD/DEAH box helicase [Gemmataceae bacterium]